MKTGARQRSPLSAVSQYVESIKVNAKQFKKQKYQPFKNNLHLFNDTQDNLHQLKGIQQQCLQLQKQRQDEKKEYGKLLQAAADQIQSLQTRLKKQKKRSSRQRQYDLQRQKSALAKQSQQLEKSQLQNKANYTKYKEQISKKYELQFTQLRSFYQNLQISIKDQHRIEVEKLKKEKQSLIAQHAQDLERVRSQCKQSQLQAQQQHVNELNVLIEQTKNMLLPCSTQQASIQVHQHENPARQLQLLQGRL